jgi:hypothetical protein
VWRAGEDGSFEVLVTPITLRGADAENSMYAGLDAFEELKNRVDNNKVASKCSEGVLRALWTFKHIAPNVTAVSLMSSCFIGGNTPLLWTSSTDARHYAEHSAELMHGFYRRNGVKVDHEVALHSSPPPL